MRLRNKVAIVTGGSRGIGKAISLGMAEEGAAVVINYLKNRAAADEAVRKIQRSGGKALAVHADVSQAVQIDQLIRATLDEFGRIDILVNNAGISVTKSFFEITEQDWDVTVDTNLKGVFLCSQAVAREMAKQGKGRIVNITSISGEVADSEEEVPYCTSKGGANMLTKVMAVCLARHGINVNAVAPGTVETDMSRKWLADPVTRENIIRDIPLKRLGSPNDIMGAVIFLASDAANWITGHILYVDGGYVAR